jgi:hypothetical protein
VPRIRSEPRPSTRRPTIAGKTVEKWADYFCEHQKKEAATKGMSADAAKPRDVLSDFDPVAGPPTKRTLPSPTDSFGRRGIASSRRYVPSMKAPLAPPSQQGHSVKNLKKHPFPKKQRNFSQTFSVVGYLQ